MMGVNTNLTVDISKLISKVWPTFLGVLIVWVIEVILYYLLFRCLEIDFKKYAIISSLFLFVTTFLVWVIHTKRWFQITGYWILIHYVIILGGGVGAYYLCYPLFVQKTHLDIAILRYCLTAFAIFILFVCSYLVVRRKHKGLCIVFMVTNKSTHESDIMQALIEAKNRVDEVASNIQIVIPPFGIAGTPIACKHYINGHFNQADALIFASLINSPEGTEFGYCFNRFTSIMSDRYVKRAHRDDNGVNMLIDESYRCHEWNTLNINNDQISRQLEVAGNLTHLFLMFVSCIYLQKHKYTDAIGIADKLYTYSSTGNKPFDDLVMKLLRYSYMSAQYNEEYDNQNYELALEILSECAKKLPQFKNSLAYDLSMARIYFYDGNLKESKKMTRHAKASHPNADWYVTVNYAFYAIFENKYREIASHYKKLLKMDSQNKDEVEYAIRFLRIEESKTDDKYYLIGLYYGIAFLSLYYDERLSARYLRKITSFSKLECYKELEPMRALIASSKGKLRIKEEKKAA